jgi:uncharacterized damage-inducible protein DinB
MIKQIPWFERKFNFNFPVGLFPVIVERLRGTLLHLKPMVENFSEEKLTIKKDGKWSVKEVVGHLYDLEELWSSRIDDFLDHNETLRAADLTNTKTNEAGHNSKTSAELLEQFSIARNDLIRKVENLDEVSVTITSLHPRLKQPMRLIDSLFFIAEHDDHELTKIRQLLNDR